MQTNSPQRIGRYDIICPLGEGGMARAYLAVNRGPGGFNKLAVVKQILPELASDANFVTMLLDEARLAARLHHPNIVQTFDVVEYENSYALAMEYLDGISLSTIYRRIHPKKFPVETHLWILSQVLTGLHYAHTLRDYDGTPLGVVHRDVNPSNVLVTFTGDVKLLDFGVAKARGALATGTDNCIKGKPGYCAPEQLRNTELDGRADVFAVGVMLWEALAGKRLNRSKTLLEAAKTRLSGNEPKIRDVRPETPAALADICDRAMAMDPEQRFPDAAEFGKAIQEQLGTQSAQGRQFLVDGLDQEFKADRLVLRQQIELHLKSADPVKTEGPTPNTMVRETPSPPPAQTTTTPLPTPPAQQRAGRSNMVIAMGIAIVGTAALLGGFFATRASVQKKEPSAAAESVTRSVARPASPAAATNQAAPVGHAPALKSPPTATATPPSEKTTPRADSTQDRAKPSAAPRGRGAARRPTGSSTTSSTTTSTTPDVARRKAAPTETPAATIEPGSHLVHPSSKPILHTVDEKDPYSP